MKINLLFILLQIQLVSAFISSVSFRNVKQFSNINTHNKIISISPAGLGGFYLLGIISYIKKHYDTSDCVILGASAGAWVSLPMVYNEDIDMLVNDILTNYTKTQLNLTEDKLSISHTLFNIQYSIKNILLSGYDESKFDLHRINIATNVLSRKGMNLVLIGNIKSLDVAISTCFASSHIPYITGDGLFGIDDYYFFDGGLCKFPPNKLNTYLNISPDMWGYQMKDIFNIKKYSNDALIRLYYRGYDDTETNKNILDQYFV